MSRKTPGVVGWMIALAGIALLAWLVTHESGSRSSSGETASASGAAPAPHAAAVGDTHTSGGEIDADRAPVDRRDGTRRGGAEEFTGSAGCRPCHERFYGLWAPSHHGRAMQPFSATLARTELASQPEPLRIGDDEYQARFEGDDGWVEERGATSMRRYPIRYMLGGKNVAYFLTDAERGRLQVLPVAYDMRRREWYDTTASAVRHFTDRQDEALDWTERPLTFNASCYGCHVSQIATNYDLETDSYQTVWSEPGINCETCHGPGGEHVRVCRQAGGGAVPDDLKIIRTKLFSPDQTNALCASCHAKMMPITEGFMPGDAFFDHYDLVTYEHPDYYPDGRDLGENYTYTSWLTSPCVAAGELDCLHCHTSSGRYRFGPSEANQACLPCHQEKVADPGRHTRHDPNGKAGRCVACHMPRSEFARMVRTDHSMRPPSPRATIEFGSPNACNLCHADKTPAWADEWVGRWTHRDYQASVLRRGRLVEAARRHDRAAASEIAAFLRQPTCDPVLGASLIRLLEGVEAPDLVAALIELARSSPSALVRSSAVVSLGRLDAPGAEGAVVDALRDPSRLVRIRAFQALGGREARGPNIARVILDRARDEYLASLRARPDDPASHHNLGNYHLDRGEWDQAVGCYETASRLGPQGVESLVNAALAHNLAGRNDAAEACLRRALQIRPRDQAANLNLGLLLGETGRRAEAVDHLRIAAETDPPAATAAYNLGVAVGEEDPEQGVFWCRRALRLEPDVERFADALAYYLERLERWGEAVDVLSAMLERHPGSAALCWRLGDLFVRLGQPDRARQVYREVLERGSLAAPEAAATARRLEALAGDGRPR